MAKQIRTHLMFDGRAEEAMNLYVSLFPQSSVQAVERYPDGENQGKVYLATFSLGESEFICIDSPIKHDFGFTPAMSIFVDCDSEEELEYVFATLSEDGSILMPLDDYGFSRRFGWVSDRFGVSWQINLPSL